VQASDLVKVERALREADLSVVLRRQPVVFSSPSQPPMPLFQELFISSVDLSRIVLPGCSLTADRWLFQHLTEILDQRMLALLRQRREPALAGDFSLNLNVATVLSEDFMTFDREVVAVSGSSVTIELQLIDIFSDPAAYVFARELLRERGYKVCLDGVKHGALPLVDRERLGVDLVKVQWHSSLIDDHAGPLGAELAEASARIGSEHLILCRCDSPKVLQIGRSMGIALYQGRYFDAVLHKMKETPAVGRAVPA
jgi:EAL domain-containing protein (putative c-di-GMP-specific phosphodiesterase class I)